jgi:PST family polysaccharide transporter
VPQPSQTAGHADPLGSDAILQQAPEITAQTVGRALSWAGVGQVVSRIFWFASLFVLAALVPPAAFGTVTAALVVISTAGLLVGSGTRGSVITNERLTTQHLRYALRLNVGVGVVVTALVVAAADPIVSTLLPARTLPCCGG